MPIQLGTRFVIFVLRAFTAYRKLRIQVFAVPDTFAQSIQLLPRKSLAHPGHSTIKQERRRPQIVAHAQLAPFAQKEPQILLQQRYLYLGARIAILASLGQLRALLVAMEMLVLPAPCFIVPFVTLGCTATSQVGCCRQALATPVFFALLEAQHLNQHSMAQYSLNWCHQCMVMCVHVALIALKALQNLSHALQERL
jgi:hypothetical protein